MIFMDKCLLIFLNFIDYSHNLSCEDIHARKARLKVLNKVKSNLKSSITYYFNPVQMLHNIIPESSRHLGDKPRRGWWCWQPRNTNIPTPASSGSKRLVNMYVSVNTRLTIIFFVNTMRPEQNGEQFADVIFKLIFLNENYCILI